MQKLRLVLLVAVLANRSDAQSMPDSVRQYVDSAMSILQRVSMHRDSVDWRALRDSVYRRAGSAQKPEETWRTLQWVLRRVDRHSFVQTPRPMPADPNAPPRTAPAPAPTMPPQTVKGELIEGRIAYLRIPGFGGGNRPSFVDSLQTFIREFDQQGACGWVIDLRANIGGNMWPMLAGVGPLLGDTIMGSFTTTDAPNTLWRYKDGRAWAGPPEPQAWGGIGSVAPHTVRNPLAPIALLTGPATTSSGEMTLTAFLGRPNTRTFGDSTGGFNSVNNGYRLPDGANLVITVGLSRDRLGRGYGLKIAPDELVPGRTFDDPAPLEAALRWLRSRSECR